MGERVRNLFTRPAHREPVVATKLPAAPVAAPKPGLGNVSTRDHCACGSPRSAQAPLSVPARAHVLPAPSLAPPPRAWPAGEPGTRVRNSVDRLVKRIREMDAPVITCAAPSCPRRPMPHGPFCVVCSDGKAADVAAELEAAGWSPVMSGKIRRGWRDPVTGEVKSAKTALEFVRRDALRVSGKASGT